MIDLKEYPNCKAGLEYAQSISDGEIPAGHYTIAACNRHIADLEKEWDYYFDPAAAEKVCKFVQLMPHTKGVWARRRESIELTPWMQFFITVTFGWKRKADDLRRFREAYLCVARKAAKSTLAAAIGNYMLSADDEHGAEVYSGATSEKQAWEVFRPARLMAMKTQPFTEAFGIGINAKSLTIDTDGSRFEPVIGKPGDGASPSCVIIDEFHQHQTSDLYDTMVTGTGARQQPLVLIITTAGSDISGPCYQKQEEMQSILDGHFHDEEKFGLIYHIDPKDDWLSDDAIYKANPNVDITVPFDFFKARQNEGRIHVHKQNAIKTKHFNVWVNAKESYFNLENWKACENKNLSDSVFKQNKIIAALDLASKQDITARIYIVQHEQNGKTHYYVKPRFYIPEDRIASNKKYQYWVAAGHMQSTPGSEIDFQVVIDDLEADSKQYDIEEIAYDPHLATHLAQRLDDVGCNMTEFLQRPNYMGEPMDECRSAIDSCRLQHDGNPVMSWMVGNVINTKPNNKLPFPGKQQPESKIDGPVALIMAIGRSMDQDFSGTYFDEYIKASQSQ